MLRSRGCDGVRAEVFIIESLGNHDQREGKIIESILRMGGRHPVYRFVDSQDELEDAIAAFYASKFRYLHISSHGNNTEFCFSFGALNFKVFADLLHEKLGKRRLFVSACECVNSNFAKLLIPSSGCYSIIGPYEAIHFDVAAITWASYYYLAFRNDQTSMKRKRILQRLKRLTNLFRVNLNYFSEHRGGIKHKRLRGKQQGTLARKDLSSGKN